MTDTNGLAEALAELQTQLPKIRKSETAQVRSEKGSYSYSYADLAGISEQLLPIMGKLGLSFTSRPTLVEGRFVLAYRLWHASGDLLEGEYPLTGGTPQAIGSAITYGRRYCLCAVTGVAPEDDDGAAATHAQQQPQQPRQRPAAKKASTHSPAGNRPAGDDLAITKPQLTKLQICLKDYGITDRAAGLAYYADVTGREVDSSKDLTRGEASLIIERLVDELRQGQDVEPPTTASGREDPAAEPDPTLDPDWQGDS